MPAQFFGQFNLSAPLGISLPIVAISGLVFYGVYLKFKQSSLRLPPGPKGTFLTMPKNPDPLPWVGYSKWAETYGRSLHFRFSIH